MGRRSADASINPAVLRWARERARYEADEVADRLQVSPERYEDWEKGVERPTLIQLRRLAVMLNRSISTFYLRKPPAEPESLRQLRRLPDAPTEEESPQLAVQVLEAMQRRQLALDLYMDLGEEPPSVSIPLDRNDDPEAAGEAIRKELAVSLSEQSGWAHRYEALHAWREALERLGVLIFHMPGVSMSEMRGLTIAGRPLPIIGINSKDAPQGRIFTILHEFSHVLLQDSVLHPGDRPLYHISSDSPIETFCNAVAAAVLVPKADLQCDACSMGKKADSKWEDSEVSSLVKRYRVSPAMMIRRLRSLRLIESHCYEALRDQYDRYRASGPEPEKGGNIYGNKVSWLGTLLPRLAFRAYYNEKITASDLSSIVGLQVKHLGKFEYKVSKFNYAFRD